MKRTLVLLALIALMSGCAWMGSKDSTGGQYSGGTGIERGTTGVSTGADAGAQTPITGSSSAYH